MNSAPGEVGQKEACTSVQSVGSPGVSLAPAVYHVTWVRLTSLSFAFIAIVGGGDPIFSKNPRTSDLVTCPPPQSQKQRRSKDVTLNLSDARPAFFPTDE